MHDYSGHWSRNLTWPLEQQRSHSHMQLDVLELHLYVRMRYGQLLLNLRKHLCLLFLWTCGNTSGYCWIVGKMEKVLPILLYLLLLLFVSLDFDSYALTGMQPAVLLAEHVEYYLKARYIFAGCIYIIHEALSIQSK